MNATASKHQAPSTKHQRHWYLVLAIWCFLGFVVALFLWPLPSSLTNPGNGEPLRLLDRNGRLLYEVRKPDRGDRDFVPLAKIPPPVVQALIATEDRSFYAHGGVSIPSILRALWQNVTAGRIVSGGSTITQQLVRTLQPGGKRGYLRKIREAFYAWKLDRRLSKDAILETFLNAAYFGHQAYGIGSASRTFLGKDATELSLGESAYLVGLLQSPSAYDPFADPAPALERRTRVLAALRETGKITPEREDEALHERILLTSGRIPIEAPHFVFWMLQERASDLPSHGDITTTLDLDLQHEAERSVERRLNDLRDRNVTSASVVVLDARNGDVLAMVGSADYFDAAHDGAVNVTLAARQPGSAVKPFTYALAFTNGDTAASTVADVETRFSTKDGNPYVPRNYDFEEHGLVRYRDALANSYNIAAVKVLERVGVQTLLTFLRAAGLTTLTRTPEHYGLALTLGDAEVRLLDLARAFALFPRGGRTLPLRVLRSDPLPPGEKILDERVAWLITDILSDNDARLPEFGSDSPLAFRRPVAAKTGTTRNARDNWTVGFTPDRVVGVWVGNADNTPMKGTSGVTGAGPIFHDVMEAAFRDLPPSSFPRPAGIVEREVCRLSGKLPTPLCRERMIEAFVQGTEPTEPDDLYRNLAIDVRNGLLATDRCPAGVSEQRVFAVFPAELERWAREGGWPVPPPRFSPLCDQESALAGETALTIVSPSAGDDFLLDPLIPLSSQAIQLRAQGSPSMGAVDWYANGRYVGTGTAPDYHASWSPAPGTWTLEARVDSESASIVVTVHGSASTPARSSSLLH